MILPKSKRAFCSLRRKKRFSVRRASTVPVNQNRRRASKKSRLILPDLRRIRMEFLVRTLAQHCNGSGCPCFCSQFRKTGNAEKVHLNSRFNRKRCCLRKILTDQMPSANLDCFKCHDKTVCCALTGSLPCKE